jgi:hypothetical protein
LSVLLLRADGSRRAGLLVLAPSVTAGERRSMIPASAWSNSEISATIARLVAAGGRIERG